MIVLCVISVVGRLSDGGARGRGPRPGIRVHVSIVTPAHGVAGRRVEGLAVGGDGERGRVPACTMVRARDAGRARERSVGDVGGRQVVADGNGRATMQGMVGVGFGVGGVGGGGGAEVEVECNRNSSSGGRGRGGQGPGIVLGAGGAVSLIRVGVAVRDHFVAG